VLNCVSWYLVMAGEILVIRLDSELVRALMSGRVHEYWVREMRVGAVCIPVMTLDSYQESASASCGLEFENVIPRLEERPRRTKKRFVLTTWLG
jgi:hypothetical protein